MIDPMAVQMYVAGWVYGWFSRTFPKQHLAMMRDGMDRMAPFGDGVRGYRDWTKR